MVMNLGKWPKECNHKSKRPKWRFLRKIEGVTLFYKVRSSEIRKSPNIEPLLLGTERSQLRWFGNVSRMLQERLPKQALLAKANGRRPVGRRRTRWTNYIEDLGWNRLGLHPSDVMEVMEDCEVWRLNFELLPRNSHGKAGNEKRRRTRSELTPSFRTGWVDEGSATEIGKSSLIPGQNKSNIEKLVFTGFNAWRSAIKRTVRSLHRVW